MRVRRYVTFAGLLLVVAGLAAAAFWPDRVDVEAIAVIRGPMEVTIDEEGETRVSARFVVSAPVTGRLLRIDLEPGDTVIGGRTIVARLVPATPPLLDPRTRAESAAAVEAALAAVVQVQAERDRAAAALELARRSLDREEMLAADGAVSQADLDRAHSAFKDAEAGHQAAAAAVDRVGAGGDARPHPARHAVRHRPASRDRGARGWPDSDPAAPERSRGRRWRSAARNRRPGAGRSRRGPAVGRCRPCRRRKPRSASKDGAAAQPLHGTVRRVEPSGFMKVSALGVEERRVNVIIDLERTPEAARLGDGYRVESRIVVWSGEAVTVPAGALFRRDRKWAVFVVEEGRVRVADVEIGQRNNDAAQILSGLTPGQTIVLHPPDTLRDGARVSVSTTP